MATKQQHLWLIDEAQLMLTLETSSAGRLWRPIQVEREQGTGRDLIRIAASDGSTEAQFEYRGPTVVGLAEQDLERERERLTRVVQAAQHALAAIDANLAQRRSWAQSQQRTGVVADEAEPDAVHVAALERHGGVQLTSFPENSRFVEVCWTLTVQADRSVHSHVDRFETSRVDPARTSSPIDLVLDRGGAEDHLAGLMGLDVHVRWLDQQSTEVDQDGLLDRCSFHCAKSGLVAGTISLRRPLPPANRHRIELSGFSLTGDTQWSLTAETLSRVRTALFCSNVRALWLHNIELAPFYCAECGVCYAASVWQARHNSASSVDGICPSGHQRRLCAD